MHTGHFNQELCSEADTQIHQVEFLSLICFINSISDNSNNTICRNSLILMMMYLIWNRFEWITMRSYQIQISTWIIPRPTINALLWQPNPKPEAWFVPVALSKHHTGRQRGKCLLAWLIVTPWPQVSAWSLRNHVGGACGKVDQQQTTRLWCETWKAKVKMWVMVWGWGYLRLSESLQASYQVSGGCGSDWRGWIYAQSHKKTEMFPLFST